MSFNANWTQSHDSTETDSTDSGTPSSKKPKIEGDSTESDSPPKSEPKERLEQTDDPECKRQRDLFYKQFEDSEGFDVDWNRFDYKFGVYNFDWTVPLESHRSNEELMKALIDAAIEDYDEQYGTDLDCAKYVSANIITCKGLIYFITFLAKDLGSSNQELNTYQAKVWKFAGKITVLMVRPRPTQLPN